MSARAGSGVPVCEVDPNYLHSNSTSHTWPFSAIAELVDNAYDPDVNAKQLWIDKTVIKDHDCLTFTDNGEGLDYDKMHKMLSFGFCKKKTVRNHVPVGLYGNGFKSGSMRLGKDAIVFSKKKDGSMCVGMLSQTYLREIEAQNVVVPIIARSAEGTTEAGHDASLRDILRYSLFHTVDELSSELRSINTQCSSDYKGTKIIIWNLRRTSADELELDFDTDRYDIRIPATEKETHEHQSSPDIEFSLRAYCSILYLKPRMQINIRGQKVNTQLICKSLAHVAKDTYKPNFTRQTIKITLGYNTQNKDHYGVMMYHKNRLIKAYERVGCQKSADKKGVGVIAVIECNFIQPTHNKQNFLETDDYRKIIKNLSGKVETYWNAVRQKKGLKGSVPVEDQPKTPDQNWVQCNDCQKWRKLPDGIDSKKLPEEWFCLLNPDPQYRDCSVEEEAEDSEDESMLLKDYKQKDRILKKRQDLGRNQTLSPFSPAQTLKRVQTPVTSTSPAPSASSSNLPVIHSVYSLFTPKRKTRSSEQNTSVKRVRTRGSLFTSTQTSDDEVIVLDEIHSSPRPSESTHVKVQSEEPASDGESASHMEFSDHTSMNAETTRRADEMTSTSAIQTQTEHPIIIKEEEDHPNEKTLDGIENANESRTSKQSPSEKQINQFSVNQPDQVKEEEDQTMFYTIQDVNNTHTSSSDTERLPQNRETDEQNYQALYRQAMEDNEKLRKEKDKMKKKEEESLKSYENLRKERDELKKGEEELLKINENLKKERDEMKELLENILEQKAGHSSTSDHHDDVDHSDDLSRELCVRNAECDELKKKLSDLEKKHSQLQKDQEELNRRFTEASTRPDASDTEMNIRLTTTQDNDQVTPAKLRDLRSKVAQLLVKFVPVLDLNQINYDCDVIDEILGQVVEEVFATK